MSVTTSAAPATTRSAARTREAAAVGEETARPHMGADGRVAVLGIRHHGPGSARSVVAELDRLQPAIVLIEGPADAGEVLALAADPGMVPPVALLAYVPEAPRVSAFWPYAVFSPEWQALAWAAAHEVPARFCDLPAAAVLTGRGDISADTRPQERGGQEAGLCDDPLAALAAAAGYDDPERWWDDVVESRLDGQSPFAALTEAMGELRAGPPAAGHGELLRERQREAHMRQVLRAALKETAGTVAVVCGAWHAPALAGNLPPAAADAALLRGLTKRKATLTWVPWTHSRLAAASGYGAGITSPGWYHHLFTTPHQTIPRWLTKVAATLRDHDLPVSSAHIIEATRLAEALAALRARPLAGLAEVNEATRAVMCEGDDVAVAFVTRELVVGERLGAVPDSAPTVPLEADLRAQARALRLKVSPLEQTLTLDLRTETGRARSVLLHRLTALDIGWGSLTADPVRATGTFREIWSLRWRPELAAAVLDAAVWGTTVAIAATEKTVHTAATAAQLGIVTAAVERVLLADLPTALGPVLRALDEKAATDCDAAHLMAAVPALVRAARYGDVRETDTAALSTVVDALTFRVCAGLPAAVTGLADDAAVHLRAAVDAMHAALGLHAQGERGHAAHDQWLVALTTLAERRDVHGLLAGRVVRLLTDTGVLPADESARRFAAHLSVGMTATAKAAWAEGFLSGGGLLLVHDQTLLAVLDGWVASLPAQDFTDVLPLLRRTFGGFTAPERANIAAAVTHLTGGPAPQPGTGEAVDADRAAGVLRTVAMILGGWR
ncbi:MAG TPA: DUF5682 family protein [Streptosporangiaceae bacterium]|nr:DUF5682 family protein [Streptosporangiaceae bacterium]